MTLRSYVDVLIIGAGPAGLMCANALAMAGIGLRIIDKRPVKVASGQGDGIQPGTTEVMQSYGLAERLIREGNQMHVAAFYSPSRDRGIECTRRVPNSNPKTAVRYPFTVTLHQGAIEAIFIDSMREHGVQVERPAQPVEIEISEDADGLSNLSSYPVKVTVEHLDVVDEESKTEIVHAKFVVGADGAHSWVRKELGIRMEGEQTDDIWGVVDIVAETNFPHIRNCVNISSENGSCIIIPREGDLVSRKILHPFELGEPKEIAWWTVYVVGQRVASSFSVKDRIFIAGDACHTHSPKAGQGMNASMNDTHNLAWKLAHVLRGWSDLSLLKTYEHERRKYAQDLISFDKMFYATLLSGKSLTTLNRGNAFREEFSRAYQTLGGFTSGTGVHYSPSMIVDPKHQKYAEKLVIGQRMLPQIFVRAADIRPIEIQDLLPADIRFKILFFVGNLTEARVAELKILAEELSASSSFLRKYNADGSISTVFDIITVVTGKKEAINYLLVPAFFRPHWTKVLLDDTDVTGNKGGDGYEHFGVDPEHITVVVVRPDGYVGTVAPSTAVGDLDNYFGSFLVPHCLDPQSGRGNA